MVQTLPMPASSAATAVAAAAVTGKCSNSGSDGDSVDGSSIMTADNGATATGSAELAQQPQEHSDQGIRHNPSNSDIHGMK